MKNRRALLVIDAQKIYTNPQSELYCPDCRGTLGRINKLIKAFEKKKLPVVFIRHQHKKTGSDLGRMFDFAGPAEDFDFKEGSAGVEYDSRLYFPKKFHEFAKTRYCSFTRTPLAKILKKEKIDTVAVCGFMTNFCCESAARTAHDLDYFVDFITDATGTPGTTTMSEKQVRRTVADFLALGFARVYNTKLYKV